MFFFFKMAASSFVEVTDKEISHVQMMDSAIRRINHYPLDNSIGFDSVYMPDSDVYKHLHASK